jgi:hypothetical protein
MPGSLGNWKSGKFKEACEIPVHLVGKVPASVTSSIRSEPTMPRVVARTVLHRAAFPHMAASEPSELKKFIRTWPGATGLNTTNPSAPIPFRRSHTDTIRSAGQSLTW